MEARGTRKRWTYAEFARLPESGRTRYEVIDDELVVTAAPGTRHQRIVAKLLTQLFGFAKEHDLGQVFPGPLDVLFADGDYLEPDILFVRKDHLDLVSDRGVEGPPDLVGEVVSPSTADRDRSLKLDRYRLYGVPEYWVVDPVDATVEVWRLAEGAKEPVVQTCEDTLAWTPEGGAPVLEIDLEELFGA